MHGLNGLEKLAYERVEELRRQGDHARLLRTLPRREGVLRRGLRAFAGMLRRDLPAAKERVLSPGRVSAATEVRSEA